MVKACVEKERQIPGDEVIINNVGACFCGVLFCHLGFE